MGHKGIILAGGTGSRLHPITLAVNKHLLPIYDKPMVYYPLTTLINAGIRDILLISTKTDLTLFHTLLGDGSKFGVKITYAMQDVPNGISEAFIIGRDFIGKDSVTLILGDNVFWGNEVKEGLEQSIKFALVKRATIFGYKVKDPKRYGVMSFNSNGDLIAVDEKPDKPKSNYAVIGMYTYPNNVIEYVKDVKPSYRGEGKLDELEITTLNQIYLDKGELVNRLIGGGNLWADTGTHESLLQASQAVAMLQDRLGVPVGCPDCHLKG